MIYYTGIGARKTPTEVLETFQKLGSLLADEGWVLRSGAADGADSAFEHGCNKANGLHEIYLPYQGFNGSESAYFAPSVEATTIAERFWGSYAKKPWDKIPAGDKLLLARDVHQVLGKDLKTPSKFIVCWTPEGKWVGGTAMALNVGKAEGIKIFNAGEYLNAWKLYEEIFIREVMKYARAFNPER